MHDLEGLIWSALTSPVPSSPTLTALQVSAFCQLQTTPNSCLPHCLSTPCPSAWNSALLALFLFAFSPFWLSLKVTFSDSPCQSKFFLSFFSTTVLCFFPIMILLFIYLLADILSNGKLWEGRESVFTLMLSTVPGIYNSSINIWGMNERLLEIKTTHIPHTHTSPEDAGSSVFYLGAQLQPHR